ncbi:MAG: matrixin family metalloprotease [Bdellovibrionaceae bacterium]|nr:matrixin family metalloprotease [Pseudobdellovibrionaceae bacterium]
MRILSFFMALHFSVSAFAFTLNSSTNPDFKGWANPAIDFSINTTNCPAGVEGLIESAFDIWRNVASSKVELRLVGTTTSTTFGNPTTIYCENNFATVIAGGGPVNPADNDSVPGVAILNPPGAEYATGGLLILNTSSGAASIATYDPTLVKIVLAHEIGHILGLGHSEDTSALMYFDASAKGTLNLAQDDIDGITYLYPRNELSGDSMFGGCGMIHNPPPFKKSYAMFLWICMSLPLMTALAIKSRWLKISSIS